MQQTPVIINNPSFSIGESSLHGYPVDSQGVPKSMDQLLNYYLDREGIGSQYTRLIRQELADATQMSEYQMEEAANLLRDELESNNPALVHQQSSTPTSSSFNNNNTSSNSIHHV